MPHSLRRVRRTLSILAAFALALPACVSTIETGTDGAGGGGAGGSSGTASGPPGVPAVAMTRAQWDVIVDEYWKDHNQSGSSTSTGSGVQLDPNDLFIDLSDLGVSCGVPFVDLSCGGHWSTTIVLPQAYQQVGVYDLSDPAVSQYSSMEETGQSYSSADDCSWGGGSLMGGTIEVVSIDEASVHIKLQVDALFEADPSGEYVAPRCP